MLPVTFAAATAQRQAQMRRCSMPMLINFFARQIGDVGGTRAAIPSWGRSHSPPLGIDVASPAA
jgi:hypothetical protein